LNNYHYTRRDLKSYPTIASATATPPRAHLGLPVKAGIPAVLLDVLVTVLDAVPVFITLKLVDEDPFVLVLTPDVDVTEPAFVLEGEIKPDELARTALVMITGI
jgi:hypothetical protein